MSFKKLVSFMLALVMLMSVSGVVTVSAADGAKLGFEVYDSAGTKVTGNLEIGEIYQVSVKLTDITARSVKSIHVVTNFDPEYLRPVRSTGEKATLPAQATIETIGTDKYDKNEGTGIYTEIDAACELHENLIAYSIAVNTAVLEEYPNGKTGIDSFEVCRFRFKALKSGETKIQLAKAALGEGNYIAAHDEGVYFYPTAEKATVAETPLTVTVNGPAYSSATVDAAFSASKEYSVDATSEAAVLADLATAYPEVSVKFENESGNEITNDCNIVWSAPADFDAGKVGTYTFEGAVSTTGVNYTGSAVKVTATVKINALSVISVTNPADIEVYTDEAINLPSTVSVKVTGDKDAALSVSWTPSSVNNTAAGVTTLTGTISGTDKITVPAGISAELKVTVKEKIYTDATVDANFKAEKTYIIGKTTSASVVSDLAAAYPTVSVKYENAIGHEVTKNAAITWSAPADFDANKSGVYTFNGTVATPFGVNYTGAALNVTAKVTVDTLKVISVVNPADIEVFVGDTITLPATVSVKVTGDTTESLPVVWTPSSVDNSAAGAATLTGTISGTEEIEVPAGITATLRVIVKEKVYTIANVDAAFSASKAYDVDTTSKQNVLADLIGAYPAVNVEFTNTYGHKVSGAYAITWSAPAEFDAGKVGTYTFEGAVSTTGVNYTGSAVKVTATVKINALSVISVTNPADIEVYTDEAINLPSTVSVKVTGDKDAALSVSWTPSSVNNTVAGVTTLTGTISGTDKITVPAGISAELKVTVKEKIYTNATVDAVFKAEKSYVVEQTTKDAILADLAAAYPAVSVKYENAIGHEVTKNAAITWSAPADFNAGKYGEYTFEGAVATPSGVNYTGSDVKVTAKVIVDSLKVLSVTSPEDMVVPAGNEIKLPETVSVKITGDTIADLPVVWTPSSVDNTAAGTTELTGILTGTDKIYVPEDMKAAFKITVVEKSNDTAPEEVEDVIVSVLVDSNNIIEEILNELPAFVIVGDGYITVTWVQTPESVKDEYTVDDVIEFVPVADGVTFPEDYTAKAILTAPEGKKTVTFDKTEITIADQKASAGYTLDAAKEAAEFTATYGDGTVEKITDIVWENDTVPAYKNNTTGTYVLTGTWSDVYGNSQTFKITVNIVSGGATSIGIYSSYESLNPIGSSIVLNTLSSKSFVIKHQPSSAEETYTCSADMPQFAKPTISGNVLTIRTAAVTSVVNITVTASSGVSTTVKVIINAVTTPGGSGSAGGGTPSTGTTTGTAVPPVTDNTGNSSGVVEPETPVTFTDLAGFEWAEAQINALRDKGIVSGRSETEYVPGGSVTRAEFLAMIVRLFGFEAAGEEKVFSDVTPDKWFYEAVGIASSLDIAYGYEDGNFDPDAVIKRQDMAVFAERALKVAGLLPEKGEEKIFVDQADISAYAVDQVLYMTAIGVINGMEDGTFKPLETANRAQAAVVIYNLLNLTDQQ